MDKKVTALSIQTDVKGAAFRLIFMTEDGAGVPVVLTPDLLSEAISALIEAGSVIPENHERQLITDVGTAQNPISVSGLAISPMQNEPYIARLTLLCGLVDLQFAIPISDLLGALEALKDATEATGAPPRPN
jgi:hypothetical protein